MKARILRLAVLWCALTLYCVGSAMASAGNLSNPGFESGDLTGWQKGVSVDFAGVVGPDGFATPNEGGSMLRLGSPRVTGQPVGSNTVYQDFTAVEPLLSFAYQIFTYEYSGYNHFHYRLLDLDTGATIEQFVQGAWGAGGTLKSTGWQTVTLDLSAHLGKRLRLELDCGGTHDQQNGTWAYVDAPRVTVPTTTASVSPLPNQHGWNNSDVTVTLSASSGEGSGAVEIHYRVDGGPEVVAAGPAVSIALTDEGVHKVLYFAQGAGGGVEEGKTLTVKIDKTKPTIAIGSPGQGRHLTSDRLAIDSTFSDTLSGVETGSITLDGVPVAAGHVIDLGRMAGKHLLRVAAVDLAGNSDAKVAEFDVWIAAALDLKPDSLNPRREGEGRSLTGYIQFPTGYDVRAIDLSTVKLEVAGKVVAAQARPTALGDYDGDGIPDRMVKFDSQEVIKLLGAATGEFTARVTGKAADGRSFEGTDVVAIVPPGRQ